MKYLNVIAFLFVALSSSAQSNNAKDVLDKATAQYQTYHSVEISFALTLNFPDRPIEHQTGYLIQEGKKFVFNTDEQSLYGNGLDVWLYLKDRNEVQINNYEEDEDEMSIITPKDLLKQYDKGRFEHILVNKDSQSAYFEFKPLEDDSDYSKFKVTIDHQKYEISEVEGFGKDGSRVRFEVKQMKVNQEYEPQTFEFDISKHPKVLVEDLRID